ncbi:MAG: hypothetical protein WCV56_08850 [Candidatus Omnitrophota bacterium]
MKNFKSTNKTVDRNFGINIIAVDENGKSRGIMFSPGSEAEETILEPGKSKITSSRPLPKESKLQIKMLFPERSDLNLVKAHGTIKWVKQVKTSEGKYFLIGVHFREASSEEKEKITKLWKTRRKAQ